jgi:putative ABC transport system permease protein
VGLSILGDLREEFDERIARGSRAAGLWYWAQALTLGARYALQRGRDGRLSRQAGIRIDKRALMADFGSDLRYGARMNFRSRAVALVAIVTLALAIGANSIVFTFANLLLIRPFPVRERERVIAVFAVDPDRGDDRARISLPDFIDWQSQAETVENLSAFEGGSLTLTDRGEPVRLQAIRASADLFRAWGLEPVRGRLFAEGEDRPGADPVVVLSHRYWAEHRGADEAVVGASLTLSGKPHTVIGVLAPEIEIGNLSLIDVWTNLPLDPTIPRDRRTLEVMARLRAGVTLTEANAEFRALAERLQEQHPETNSGWDARVVPFNEAIVGRNTWLLLALLALIVTLVFLIACANVTNVLLAQLSHRTRELAVRLALGAGSFRLARQLAAESLMLGIAGGVLGIVFAHLGLAAIRAVDAEPFFRMLFIDRNVLAYATVLSVAAPVLVSLAPAAQAAGANLRSALHEGAPGSGSGPRARRSRNGLLVFQLSAAVALLIVSGLIDRTVLAIQRIELGFRPAGVLMARLELDSKKHPEPGPASAFADTLLENLAALPEVRHAGATDRMPLFDPERVLKLAIEGVPRPAPSSFPRVVTFRVTPDYFLAMGIELVEGRVFDSRDRASGARVALVNREMASRYWPKGASALGARIQLEDAEGKTPWLEIVGVVANVVGVDRDAGMKPQVYLPFFQHPERAMTLVLSTNGPLSEIVPRLRREVSSLDPELALYDVELVEATLHRALGPTRIVTGMFVGFAAVALALAAAGLYGVLSYTVSVRAFEFGTRMALGARARDIRRLVLSQGARVVLAGAGLGLLAGLGLAESAKRVLYRVSPTDPMTIVGTLALVSAVALLAISIPAHRATRIDPLSALKSE